MLRSLFVALTLLLSATPALAQSPQAQMNARIAALCDADPACMARAREAIRTHCAGDRDCMRAAIQRAEQNRGEQNPRLSDLPEDVQDLVRALLALGESRGAASGAGGSASGGALPESLVARLEALPQRLQDRIRRRCDVDPDCIREALDEARERRDARGDDTTAPETEPETEPEPETEAPGSGTGTRPGLQDPSGTPRDLDFERRPDTTPEADAGGTSSGNGIRDTQPRFENQREPRASGGADETPRGSIEVYTPEREADEGPIVYGAGRTTWISGNSDDRMRTLMAPDGAWLVGIRMAENSDDPCEVDAYFATEDFVTSRATKEDQIDGDGSSEGLSRNFEQCEQEGGGNATSARLLALNKTSYTVTADYPYGLSYSGDPYAINGIQVCQRESNDLLKGLRVYNVLLDLDATPVETEQLMKEIVDIPTASEVANGAVPETVDVPSDLEFERPNCNDWATERMCPAGQVAIGLDIHYNNASSGRAQITGLALHCAELTR